MMNSWDRLKSVIELSGLSVNAFALSIGLKRAENLYQIKKGNHEISRDLAYKIAKKYCNISEAWLLTGTGEMLSKQSSGGGAKKIPLYDSGFEDLRIFEEDKVSTEPLYYIEVPTLSGCDLAAICYGNSMEPDIPAGAIVTLKEMDTSSFLTGEMYFVVTEKYSTIKSVMHVEDQPLKYRLIPKNITEYGETVIDKGDILRLFLVKGVISTRVL